MSQELHYMDFGAHSDRGAEHYERFFLVVGLDGRGGDVSYEVCYTPEQAIQAYEDARFKGCASAEIKECWQPQGGSHQIIGAYFDDETGLNPGKLDILLENIAVKNSQALRLALSAPSNPLSQVIFQELHRQFSERLQSLVKGDESNV